MIALSSILGCRLPRPVKAGVGLQRIMQMRSLVTFIVLLCLILLASISVYSQDTKNAGGLTLRGRILKVELTRKESDYGGGDENH
jgi:hypothetical protein